jgi:threonine synthase
MTAAFPELVSTRTGTAFPFSRIGEFAPDEESLEVVCPNANGGTIGSGRYLWDRFADFLPFASPDPACSLGEGNTPLLPAPAALIASTGVQRLLLKNETQNPTWSFKDRGSLTCIWMAQQMGERVTATISTGNMGHSIAAYAAHAGLRAIVFAPAFTPTEKLHAMAMHGALILRIEEPDYAIMKQRVLALADDLGLRIVSGNGPIRVEGYKLTAFEMVEQLDGDVPDWIVVPTSACGHLRGIFKGYRELHAAGIIPRLPRMIIVQATNNSPIVSAVKQGKDHLIPFADIHTIAEAITSGNPPGGDELLEKARAFGWLAEDVSEQEIIEAQRSLALSGFFVEPAAATGLPAVRKLAAAGKIHSDERVVIMLTGAGLKDINSTGQHRMDVQTITCDHLREKAQQTLDDLRNARSPLQ